MVIHDLDDLGVPRSIILGTLHVVEWGMLSTKNAGLLDPENRCCSQMCHGKRMDDMVILERHQPSNSG